MITSRCLENYLIPRQQAWYGDPGMNYTTLELPFHQNGTQKCRIKKYCGKYANTKFNSVLVNYYETGKEYSAWHSDNEKELG